MATWRDSTGLGSAYKGGIAHPGEPDQRSRFDIATGFKSSRVARPMHDFRVGDYLALQQENCDDALDQAFAHGPNRDRLVMFAFVMSLCRHLHSVVGAAPANWFLACRRRHTESAGHTWHRIQAQPYFIIDRIDIHVSWPKVSRATRRPSLADTVHVGTYASA